MFGRLKRKRCVLHVGTMKTGTTSIQAWLSDNSDGLQRKKWHYPGWPFRNAEGLAELLDQKNPPTNIVISDEGLFHFSRTARSDTPAIAESLKAADYHVTVLVYFRRPDHFVEAWFKQGLKNGSGRHAIKNFLALPAVRARTLERKLDDFCTLFGEENLIVAPYERSQFIGGDLLSDFLTRSKLPSPPARKGSEAAPTHNVSPGADTMLMAGLMRKAFNLKQPQINALLRTVPAPLIEQTRTSILTADEAAELRAEYRPFYAQLHNRFGTGTAPDFIRDWGEDKAHPPVSPLRDIYDHYIAQIDGD